MGAGLLEACPQVSACSVALEQAEARVWLAEELAGAPEDVVRTELLPKIVAAGFGASLIRIEDAEAVAAAGAPFARRPLPAGPGHDESLTCIAP